MKIATICENRVFSRAYSKGKKFAGKYSVIYVLKNPGGKTRVGLTVTKARGGAVTRNRIKRVLRHAYASVFTEYGVPVGYDFVIVARDAAAYVKSDKAAKDMEYAMKKLGVISEKTDHCNVDPGKDENDPSDEKKTEPAAEKESE